MAPLRVSVVQCCTAPSETAFDLEATLDKIERLTQQARDRDGSSLCVLPEATIGGYPRGSSFDTVIGSRGAPGREEFTRYAKGAVTIPGSAISRLESIASRTGVFLVVGVIEQDTASSTLFCTAVYVSPTRGYVGKHRKLMPTGSERLVWGQGDEKTIGVIQADLRSVDETPTTARLAAVICWENFMPLFRTHLYSQGVQLYCAPTVDARESWPSTMRACAHAETFADRTGHIALEGRCFVLSACQFSQQKDYAPTHAVPPPGHGVNDGARDPEEIQIGGGSMIVGPLGTVLAGPLTSGEGILTAEIELDQIIGAKYDLDVVGHYARHDIFQLNVKA